jgi:hypothetical protein
MATNQHAKPRIYATYYPKSGRSFWRVSVMPKKFAKMTDVERERWQAAYNFTQTRNPFEDRRNAKP